MQAQQLRVAQGISARRADRFQRAVRVAAIPETLGREQDGLPVARLGGGRLSRQANRGLVVLLLEPDLARQDQDIGVLGVQLERTFDIGRRTFPVLQGILAAARLTISQALGFSSAADAASNASSASWSRPSSRSASARRPVASPALRASAWSSAASASRARPALSIKSPA